MSAMGKSTMRLWYAEIGDRDGKNPFTQFVLAPTERDAMNKAEDWTKKFNENLSKAVHVLVLRLEEEEEVIK